MNTLITDNDSTLMEQEILDEIARYAGSHVFEEIQNITNMQMNGSASHHPEKNMTFRESLEKRVNILVQSKRKITIQDLMKISREKMSFSEGAEACIQNIIEQCGSLKGKFFIFSGGFQEIISKKVEELHISKSEIEVLKTQIYANCFAYNKSREICGVDWEKSVMWQENAKQNMTKKLIEKGIIKIDTKIIGLGDGSNDIGMVPEEYGYCVAYTGIVKRQNTIEKAKGKTANNLYEVVKDQQK